MKNSYEDKIIINLAISHRVSKKAIQIISLEKSVKDGDKEYQKCRREVRKIETENCIRHASSGGYDFWTWGPMGPAALREKRNEAYEYAQQMDCFNYRGYDNAHVRPELQTSEAVAMMQVASVRCGPQHEPLARAIRNENARFDAGTPVFLTRREMREDPRQKLSNADKARFIGAIYAKNYNGLVYNIQSNLKTLFSIQAERNMFAKASTIYFQSFKDKNIEAWDIKRAIIFFKPEISSAQSFLKQALEYEGKNKAGKYLSALVTENPSSHFSAIPMNTFGISILKMLIKYGEEKIHRCVFSAEEIEAGMGTPGDGRVGNLICFSFMTMDIAKATGIKKIIESNPSTQFGLCCWDDPISEKFIDEYVDIRQTVKRRRFSVQEIESQLIEMEERRECLNA